MVDFKQLDRYRLRLPASGEMQVEPLLFASQELVLEAESLRQLCAAATVAGVRRVVGTPDIHVGYGVPIGCVLATEGTIVPAAVGYDINCGMRLITTGCAAAPETARKLAQAVRAHVPLGEGKKNVRLRPEELDLVLADGVAGLVGISRHLGQFNESGEQAAEEATRLRMEDFGGQEGRPDAVSQKAKERGLAQLGTLGGGNHFIEFQEVLEVGRDTPHEAWGLKVGELVVMIHSGSRGLGHQVADEYMRAARHFSRKGELSHLEVDDRQGRNYIGAMHAAANFAYANRHVIMGLVLAVCRELLAGAALRLLYDVTHNMAKLEEHGGRRLWVHRKGATRAFGPQRMAGTPFAQAGQPVLIPGSMGTPSYVLVPAPGAEEALWSVNHGAGRAMSRAAARGKLSRKGQVLKSGKVSDEDFQEAMRGVYLIAEDWRNAKEEAPQAYKDIDQVIETVVGAGLARVVAKVKPLAVLKG